MKTIMSFFAIALSCIALGGEAVSIKSVEAQQRYPWNGLVDIAVTVDGSEDDIAELQWSFVATNSATGAAVPVASVSQNGSDTGSGTTWTRRFIWNATNDVGEVKIDDLALTACAKVLGGVQLWENGPYWAECNVGATKPEEYGYYFWWGDTVGYKRNANNDGWVSVKDGSSFSFGSGTCPTDGKDNSTLQSLGYIDSTGNLVAAHDAATAHLGAPWRMPTYAEMSTLISNCDTTWTTRNGVAGRLVTGRGAFSSESIFLPAAGSGSSSWLDLTGSYGYYWSSSSALKSDYSGLARDLYFLSSGFYGYRYASRKGGESVRPLRAFNQDGVSETTMDAATTYLKLDSRTCVRICFAEGEKLSFDARWCNDGDEAQISENGIVLTNGISGVYMWVPETCCLTQHVLRLEILSAGKIVDEETAEFSCAAMALKHVAVVTKPAVEPTSSASGMTAEIRCSRCGEIVQAATVVPALGYIRNVTARQLWPHNKVALEFTVAEDIGEVTGVDEKLFAWCAREDVTNLSSRILGDHSARPGVHRIVWDMEADGLRFVNAETAFGVVFLGGVQLWENGPYWAECNVGASRPEEYGYYFWWGDTVGYSSSSFGSGNGSTYNKNYSQLLSDGYIDSTGNLVAAHDAATAHLGAPWRMPTDAELSSLINNCVTEWTVRNGVYGLLITGKGAFASKSIFLPAAGYGYGRELLGAGTLGDYWSSTPSPDVSYSWGLSRGLGINSSDFNWDSYRYYLQSVRPLRGFIK